MRAISQEEYEAAHRIFNHVEEVVGPYYGHKTLDEVMGFISQNRWIMFPVNSVTSLREGTMFPMPNVFIASDTDEIHDDGTGRTNGFMGVTYHNVEAMLIFRDMLRRRRNNLLVSVFTSFPEDWAVEIQHKTKADHDKAVPIYDVYESYAPSEITAELLSQTLEDSDLHLLQYGDIYPKTGNPVIWSISISVVSKDTSIALFDDDIQLVFQRFFQLLTAP
jgi:hypothetical protein